MRLRCWRPHWLKCVSACEQGWATPAWGDWHVKALKIRFFGPFLAFGFFTFLKK